MRVWNRNHFICMVALAGAGLIAQDFRAALTGRVMDQTGASVAGVAIQIRNVDTNEAVSAMTDAQGNYTAPLLRPGAYSMEVEASGFKKFVREGLILQVAQVAKVDITLEVGALTERVTVTADAPLLEASTSSIGKVVDNRRILELPLNTRNVYSLVVLTPGIAGTIGERFDGMNWSAFGTRRRSMDILIDGATASQPTVTGYSAVSVFPSVDAIQEFKVTGANVPAEYGRTLGTVLNVVYKSGTNSFHGTAYSFLRNSVFDANNFFANRRGEKLRNFQRNQFGGVVSGPIRRDKTFFMGSFEGLRERRFSNTTLSVPTLREREGDFSQTLAGANRPVNIFDPFTTRASGSGFLRDAFAGNRIPVSRMDAVGRNVLKYYPLPTDAGDPFTQRNNYSRTGSYAVNTDNYDARIDHNLTGTQKLMGRYSKRNLEDVPAILFPGDITIAEGRIINEDRNHHAVAEHNYALSPSSVLTSRLGFSRTLFPFINQGIGFLPSSLGLPKVIDNYTDQVMFPRFEAAGYASLGHRDHRRSTSNTFSASSSLAQTRGPHTLKFGFEGRLFRSNTRELRSPSGEFRFNAAFTQGPNPLTASATAGNGLASLLLGTGISGDRLMTQYKDEAAQSYYLSGYAQDDWRITSKLTLNLGLRWDMDTPRTERFDHLNYFDPNVRSPLAGVIPGLPELRGGLIYQGVDGNGRHQYDWDWHNFAPRVGFAYQATARTVIRAGYAHVYSASFKAASGTDTPYGFRGETPWISTLDGITPLNLLSNPYPVGLGIPKGNSEGLLSAVGFDFRPKFRDDKVPWARQWNVTLQRELPGQLLVEAGYVGTRGYELALERYPNQLDPRHMALGSQLNQLVANPFFGHPNAGGILAGRQVRRAQLLRPFPHFAEIVGARDTGGRSWYNGLLVGVKKRMLRGLQLEGSYTWSKTLDFGEDTVQNEYDKIASRAVAQIDIPHRFVMSYLYELPFGRGRAWGSSVSSFVNGLIGGWQINGITIYQSGLPLSITASNTAGIFNPRTTANNNGQSGKLSGRAQDRLTKWFNTSVFSQPAPFTFGTASARTHDLRAHGTRNFDLSLFKEFQAGEKLKLQFRTEALNAFNTVQFSAPNTGVTSSTFGLVATQANAPRQVQFGLKMLW
ncbi:MAG: TonB-dependent receptor [Acidimicrobiia bacterium]|nr:TonB-dependent receptor [Acidimicrobiia bacterium]